MPYLEDDKRAAHLFHGEYQKKVLALGYKRKAVEKEENRISKKKAAVQKKVIDTTISKAAKAGSSSLSCE